MRHYKGVKCIKIRRSKTIYSDVMIGYVQNPNKTTKTQDKKAIQQDHTHTHTQVNIKKFLLIQTGIKQTGKEI